MLSGILIYRGDIERANESVAAWQAQDYTGDRELVIVNCATQQRLTCDVPGVRVIKADRQFLPPQARNHAIDSAAGDFVVHWPESDICLPNHLSNIASRIGANDWLWFDREFVLVGDRIVKLSVAGAFNFFFTKKAWKKAGRYSFGANGNSDRMFIGKVTSACRGEKMTVLPPNISFIRVGTEADKRSFHMIAASITGDVAIKPKLSRDYRSLVKMFLGGKKEKNIIVVMLGRNGDIINILPFLKLIHDNYQKPHIGIAKEFLPLFDGIGYATPVVLADKEEDLGVAISKAKADYDIVIRAQIWGRGHVQKVHEESYNQQSFRDIGLIHRFHDETLRPVFDRRNRTREQAMIPAHTKPMLLVNLSGAVSAPCPACRTIMPVIVENFGATHTIVDLSEIKAERLYDLLGLMEQAQALISLDTSYVHLALATNIPVVLLTRTGWGGTVMRFNCSGRILYDDAVADPNLVIQAIHKALLVGNKTIDTSD